MKELTIETKAQIIQEVKKFQNESVKAISLIDGSYKRNLHMRLDSLCAMAGMESKRYKNYSDQLEGRVLSLFEQSVVQNLGLNLEVIMFLIDSGVIKEFLMLEWKEKETK